MLVKNAKVKEMLNNLKEEKTSIEQELEVLGNAPIDMGIATSLLETNLSEVKGGLTVMRALIAESKVNKAVRKELKEIKEHQAALAEAAAKEILSKEEAAEIADEIAEEEIVETVEEETKPAMKVVKKKPAKKKGSKKK